jgi:hypothetical protein
MLCKNTVLKLVIYLMRPLSYFSCTHYYFTHVKLAHILLSVERKQSVPREYLVWFGQISIATVKRNQAGSDENRRIQWIRSYG